MRSSEFNNLLNPKLLPAKKPAPIFIGEILCVLNELLSIPKRGQGTIFILTGEIFKAENLESGRKFRSKSRFQQKNAIKQSKPSSKMQRVSA